MMKLHGMVVENNKPIYSYDWLCEMMQKRKRVSLVTSNGHFQGLVNGIRPEDGSGNNWLVTLCDNLITKEVFIRAT